MEARLRPLTVPGEQVCRDYAIHDRPACRRFSATTSSHQMGLVNHFVLRGDPHKSLSIHAESTGRNAAATTRLQDLNLLAEDWPMLADAGSARAVRRISRADAACSAVRRLGRPGAAAERSGTTRRRCPHEIYTQFEYVPGSTDISTPLAEFVDRSGAASARTTPT